MVLKEKRNIRLIYLIYALSLVIIIIISSLFYIQLQNFSTYSHKVDRTQEVINQLELLKLDLVNIENNQLDFMIRKHDSLLEPEIVVHARLTKHLEELKQLTSDSEVQRHNFILLQEAVTNKFSVFMFVWQYAQGGNQVNYQEYFDRSKRSMDNFRRQSKKMVEHEKQMLEESFLKKQMHEERAPTYLLMILGVTSLFQVMSFALLLREFRRRVKYQKELEDKIRDLNVTNAELEQIAFVTSHDLQEPLRKIRTFSDRLMQKHHERLEDDGKQMLQKINQESGRVQGLMADLVNYSVILHSEDEVSKVDLNLCFQEARAALIDQVKQKQAVLSVAELPIIIGHYKQLYLLWYNLLDNALKFSRHGYTPVIAIDLTVVTAQQVNEEISGPAEQEFYKITVSDNGIGFDNDYGHKIFYIFQRLHTHHTGYAGKGIGLAICKRVVMNHNGFITATGEPGKGATFNIYLPATVDDQQ